MIAAHVIVVLKRAGLQDRIEAQAKLEFERVQNKNQLNFLDKLLEYHPSNYIQDLNRGAVPNAFGRGLDASAISAKLQGELRRKLTKSKYWPKLRYIMSLGGAKYLKYYFAEKPSDLVEEIGQIMRTPM